MLVIQPAMGCPTGRFVLSRASARDQAEEHLLRPSLDLLGHVAVCQPHILQQQLQPFAVGLEFPVELEDLLARPLRFHELAEHFGEPVR